MTSDVPESPAGFWARQLQAPPNQVTNENAGRAAEAVRSRPEPTPEGAPVSRLAAVARCSGEVRVWFYLSGEPRTHTRKSIESLFAIVAPYVYITEQGFQSIYLLHKLKLIFHLPRGFFFKKREKYEMFNSEMLIISFFKTHIYPCFRLRMGI